MATRFFIQTKRAVVWSATVWQAVVLLFLSGPCIDSAWAGNVRDSIGLGRTPTTEEIGAWDIAIGPEGKELPDGRGTAVEGAVLYRNKCVVCHGEKGAGGVQDVLVGGQGSLATAKPLRTIGSFWPYATTVYDYIYRSMPFPEPGSLQPSEVYALTAYLLYLNGIIGEQEVTDAATLPRIRMPNRDGFLTDPRPEKMSRPATKEKRRRPMR